MDDNQPNFPVEPQQPETPTPAPAGSQSKASGTPQSPLSPKKPKKSIIIGSIVAGALVILGGGGALAYNLWYQNPEKVLFDAISHAFKAESATGTGEISIKSDDVNVKVTFDGEGKRNDGRVNTKVKIDGKSEGESITIDVTASLLVKGETFYFKLDNVKETVETLAKSYGGVPAYFDAIIEKIDGQWVSVKASDYEDISKEVSKQQKCMTELFEELSSNKDMKKELINLYKENRILVIDEQLPSKKVDGVGSLGYEISADTEATVNFIKGLGDTEYGKGLKKCDDNVDFNEAADAIKEAKKDDSDTEVKFEIWASRFGHQITEVKTTIKDDEASGLFVFNPKFNKDVNVEAPSDVITIKQLQKDIEKAMEEYYSTMFDQDMYSTYDDEDYSSYNLN